MDISIIIRIILSLMLLYGVYTETGVWTTLSLFLVFTGMEIVTQLMRKRT